MACVNIGFFFGMIWQELIHDLLDDVKNLTLISHMFVLSLFYPLNL